uniref:RNA-directed DNA polymerase n=1 Tax=Cacopsylla melanoneura TaxID=428564 RepID=A0A8D9DQL5_9HEMI
MRNDLKVLDDLLYYQDRTVIPTSLKQKALEALHTGHMGITKTNLRVQQLFYWINLNKEIESFINKWRPFEIKVGQVLVQGSPIRRSRATGVIKKRACHHNILFYWRVRHNSVKPEREFRCQISRFQKY